MYSPPPEKNSQANKYSSYFKLFTFNPNWSGLLFTSKKKNSSGASTKKDAKVNMFIT
jgi:hypothetical protein